MSSLPFSEKFVYMPPLAKSPRGWHHEALNSFQIGYDSATSWPFTFLVYAGTGSGKTFLSALISGSLLNAKTIQRVVFICPNRAIQKTAIAEFDSFGIKLVKWNNGKYKHGEPSDFDGGALTYQSLDNFPEIQRRLARKPTLVIFDEIHHLGDRQQWCSSAIEAFGDTAKIILGLSGTPYRTDKLQIPFANYFPEENGLRRFKADYTYTLGRAVAEEFCRKPVFRWLAATVRIPVGNGHRYLTFNDVIDEETANLMLSGAVRSGSKTRQDALKIVFDELGDRKLIIFVGGDTFADILATNDARDILPDELVAAGFSRSEIEYVTSDDKDALSKISQFGKSNKRVLITVNMVSEGVDIPELSAALFLTTITAKSSTTQRIGRVLRGRGSATIWLFKHSNYLSLSEEIEEEVKREARLRSTRISDTEDNHKGSAGHRTQPNAIGISACPDGVSVSATHYTEIQVEAARRLCQTTGFPTSRVDGWVAMALKFMHSGTETS